ncbi:hypothetical protein D3C72_2135520 [compost metagenome]
MFPIYTKSLPAIFLVVKTVPSVLYIVSVFFALASIIQFSVTLNSPVYGIQLLSPTLYSFVVAVSSKLICTFTPGTFVYPVLSGTISTNKVPAGGITISLLSSLYFIQTSFTLSSGIVIGPV